VAEYATEDHELRVRARQSRIQVSVGDFAPEFHAEARRCLEPLSAIKGVRVVDPIKESDPLKQGV